MPGIASAAGVDVVGADGSHPPVPDCVRDSMTSTDCSSPPAARRMPHGARVARDRAAVAIAERGRDGALARLDAGDLDLMSTR
jgi:hypothetical protein